MKKFILLLLTLLSASSLFAEVFSIKEGKITFTLNSDTHTGTVTTADRTLMDAIIPGTITHEGEVYTITKIGIAALKNCADLRSVTIPPTIKLIESGAFNGSKLATVNITDVAAWCNIEFKQTPLQFTHRLCLNGVEIRHLVIPASVEAISAYAFAFLDNLESVKLPASLACIGKDAFYGCTGLEKCEIADIAAWCNIELAGETSNPLSVANHLYINGVEVTELKIPEGVETISIEAFKDCSSLKGVKLPASLARIGKDAFAGCSGLEKCEIADIAKWCNIELAGVTSNPVSSANHLYINGAEITELEIPEGVEFIAPYTFNNACHLTALHLPQSLTQIGQLAFASCMSLKDGITISPNLKVIGPEAFVNCGELGALRISDLKSWCEITLYSNTWISSQTAEAPTKVYLELDGEELTDVTIPDGATLHPYIFYKIRRLNTLTIPDSFTDIPAQAFYGSWVKDRVTIGSNVKNIGKEAFAYCGPKEVYCYARKPPICDGDQFTGVKSDYKPWKPQLYTPPGTSLEYATATIWDRFPVAFAIPDYEAGIKDVEPAETSVVEVYNLQGIRLNISSRSELQQLPKGLYIINGRKEMIK